MRAPERDERGAADDGDWSLVSGVSTGWPAHEPRPVPRPIRFIDAPSGEALASGNILQPFVDESCTSEDFRTAFLSAFGTTQHVIAETLFNQILNLLHTDPAQPLHAATANLVLALVQGIGPRDQLEAMLATQLI